jgi:hypothetical protein
VINGFFNLEGPLSCQPLGELIGDLRHGELQKFDSLQSGFKLMTWSNNSGMSKVEENIFSFSQEKVFKTRAQEIRSSVQFGDRCLTTTVVRVSKVVVVMVRMIGCQF